MKAYLVAMNGMPTMCCTSEDNADERVEKLSKIMNNVGVCKIPIDLEIDKDTIIQLAHNVLDDFEDMLADKGIKIPSEDREGNEEEACLFGDAYYDLEDKVIDTIENTLE